MRESEVPVAFQPLGKHVYVLKGTKLIEATAALPRTVRTASRIPASSSREACSCRGSGRGIFLPEGSSAIRCGLPELSIKRHARVTLAVQSVRIQGDAS